MEGQSVKPTLKQFHKFLDETPMPMKPQFFDAEAVESRFSKSTKKILKDSANARGTVKEKGVRGKYLKRYTEIQSVLKTQSYHEGANDERTAILAKARRDLKSYKSLSVEEYLKSLLLPWLLQRNERYKKNPGGL